MKVNDARIRRGFLKKLVVLTTGFFTLKTSEAKTDESFRILDKTSDSHSLQSLESRRSSELGESFFITKFNETKPIDFNSDFSGYFVSVDKGTIKTDGYINIQGPNCVWCRVLNGKINVDWFGASGDGINDDSNAIHLANDFATAHGLPLYFSSNKKYLLSGSYEIDVANTSWHGGEKTILQWTESPDKYAIRVFSSQSVYSRTRVNNKVALTSLTILGGQIRHLYDSHALSIGGSEKSSSLFTFKNINIQGWAINVYFDDNSWRIKFEDCLFLWGRIVSKPHAVNSGECMFFSNCMFADDFSSTELYTGDWHFVSCSIDNHEIKVFGDASVYFDNGHIENPGRKNHKFTAVGVYSKDASASITNTRLIISDTPKVITTPIFYVADENVSLGIYINNLRYDQKSNFNPSIGDEKGIFLIGGNGKVVIDNVFVNVIDNNYMALSKSSNLLKDNLNFDSGLEGWTTSGNVNIQSVVKYVSNNCLQMSGLSKVECSFDIMPKDIITGGIWTKISSGDKVKLAISISFVDAEGGVIMSHGYKCEKHAPQDWQWVRLGAITPNNAKLCKFLIVLMPETDQATNAYFDGLVLSKANK